MCLKEIYFIRLEDGEKVSLKDVVLNLANEALGKYEVGAFIATAEQIAKYNNGEEEPKSNPIEALRIFLYLMHKGLYPPPPILKRIETAIAEAYHSTEPNRPTIDKMLGVSGIKHAKKFKSSIRDSLMSRDYHILVTHFGLSQENAGGMVINKYIIIDSKMEAPGLMTQSVIEETGMPEDARRIAQIYHEQRRKNPKKFWDVPENFDEKLFLMSFDEDEVKELIYHNQPNSFRKLFPRSIS